MCSCVSTKCLYSTLTTAYLTGDIVSFSVFGQAFVILNSRRVAVDLYDKRSKIYSDKPNVPLLERTGWDFNLGTMPYGSKWRAHRRTFHEKFRPDAAVSYRPVQLSSMHALLRGILEDPVDYMEALRTYVLMKSFVCLTHKAIDFQLLLSCTPCTAIRLLPRTIVS